MDEVIFINIEGYKKDEDFISISKVRLWPAMLASLQWLLRNSFPGNRVIQSGIGLLIINNLAISVEGFITDILSEKLDNNEEQKPVNFMKLETSTWKMKKKIYNETFQRKLDTYAEFKTIEILFMLRNNISHGRSHSEMTRISKGNVERSKLKSINSSYQIVREYLIEKGLYKVSNTPSNIETLWKMEIVIYFLQEVKRFLFDILSAEGQNQFSGIGAELNNAFVI